MEEWGCTQLAARNPARPEDQRCRGQLVEKRSMNIYVSRGWRIRLEDTLVILSCALATVYLEWSIIFDRGVFQVDALIHEYWMRRFQDGALFHDPLTRVLVHSGYVPVGVQALYYGFSWLVDPVRLGAVGAVAVAPVSAWLVFRIVRAHTEWRPAGWLGAALFLLPWNVQQFNGMHARAFGEPVVLLTLYLLLRRRLGWAALMPPVGMLLYPPAAAISLIMVIVAAVRSLVDNRRYPARRMTLAVGSAAATAFAALAPTLANIQHSDLISESAARHYAEFSDRGQMHFFSPSTIEMLKGPYSGFDLDTSGGVLLAGFIAVLLVPGNVRRVQTEVWVLAAACLGMFAASYGILFRLYLPSRYVHPMIGVFCIVIAVCWRPTWAFIARGVGSRPSLVAACVLPPATVWLGTCVIPLGPQLTAHRLATMVRGDKWLYLAWGLVAFVLAGSVLLRTGRYATGATATFAAILAGTLLVGGVAVAGGGQAPGLACRDAPLYRYLQSLPKATIVAGDPVAIDCVPIAAERPVLISKKLYQVYDRNVFQFARPRMFAEIRAYYGSSRRDIVRLRTVYGADVIVVNRNVLRSGGNYRYAEMAPFNHLVRRLRRTVREPATLRLPSRCMTWSHGSEAVYSLRCLTH